MTQLSRTHDCFGRTRSLIAVVLGIAAAARAEAPPVVSTAGVSISVLAPLFVGAERSGSSATSFAAHRGGLVVVVSGSIVCEVVEGGVVAVADLTATGAHLGQPVRLHLRSGVARACAAAAAGFSSADTREFRRVAFTQQLPLAQVFESLRDRGCVVEAVLPTVDLVDVTCPAGWSRRVRAEASIIVGPDLGSLPTAGNEWFENWTLLVKGDEGGRAFLVQMQFVAPPDKPATTPLLVFRGRLRCTLERQLGLPPESGAPACR